MIFGLPKLYGYLGIALAVLLAVGAIYGKGRSDGKQVIQARLDEQRETWKTAFDKQAAETKQTEAVWAARLKEQERGLQAKLDAAESSVGGLSRRLRLATVSAGQCAVSGDSAATGEPSDASGVSTGIAEIERDADAAWAAAARDSARLTACQLAYNTLRE